MGGGGGIGEVGGGSAGGVCLSVRLSCGLFGGKGVGRKGAVVGSGGVRGEVYRGCWGNVMGGSYWDGAFRSVALSLWIGGGGMGWEVYGQGKLRSLRMKLYYLDRAEMFLTVSDF